MNNKELEKKIEELREEVQSLREENRFLTNRADDYHLLGVTAEKISSAGDEKEIISIFLDYVSSLTNVSYCSYLTLSKNHLQVADEYALNTDSPLKGKRFPFDGKCENLLTNKKSFTEILAAEETPAFIPQLNCCLCPNSYYLFPIICGEKPSGWLLFVNCLEGASYLRSHITLLDRTGEIVRARVEALRSHVEIMRLNEALNENMEKKVYANRLLDCIYNVQSQFITFREEENLCEGMLRESFNDLLHNLLELTKSEYGFIGEILHEDDGAPYIKTWSITNISWNEETRVLYQKFARDGMEFHNMNTLFGAVIKTGEHVISNSPVTDPRRGGLPEATSSHGGSGSGRKLF